MRRETKMNEMMSSQTSSGFQRTPVSKFFLGTAIGSSVLLNFPLRQYQLYFIYTHTQVFEKCQLWRLFTSKLAYLDLKDLFLCSVLIYNFRVFERRLGSRKFCEYLLGTGLLATLLELLAVFTCRTLELPVGPLPTGPLCMVYPLFVRYYCDIPRVPMSHVWGIPMTGKSLSYILGLQVASSSTESLLVAACGILSGMLWRANFLQIQRAIQIPDFICRLCGSTLGRLLGTSSKIEQKNTNIGATLELQRQETMERLEQQVLWQSIQNSQRNMHIGRPQPQNVANGPGIFGIANNNGPDLNGRERLNVEEMEVEDEDPVEVSEDQVQILVEMGFNAEQVRQALQASNNDISTATNFLLQQS